MQDISHILRNAAFVIDYTVKSCEIGGVITHFLFSTENQLFYMMKLVNYWA